MNRKHFEYGTLPVSSSLDTEDDPSSSITHHDHHHQRFFGYLIRSPDSEQIRTFLNITTNILEWYAFAIFGYLSDVLGAVFFPAYDSHGNPTSPNTVLIQSFAVFGGAFFVRPFGGLAFGYLGDVYGRPLALISSILLMGVSTIGMACLPTYQHMGKWSTIGLIVVRLLQGFSAGGQLMSSLVFGVESRPAHQWGFYGAFVVAAANLGTLLAGASVSVLRQQVAPQTLETWGWRIPNFVAGVFLLVLGYLLKHYSPAPAAGLQEDEDQDRATTSTAATATGVRTTSHDSVPRIIPTRENPLRLAFAAGNRRSLLAACMVPVLGSSGFYLTFVWMAMYMYTLSPHPIPSAFAINAWAIFCSIILFFPVAGHWSDIFGRRRVMTIGGVIFGLGAPIGLRIISQGVPWWAFGAQLFMGTALSLWCAPMAAWLAESFAPQTRLTNVAVGYNVGVGLFSGVAPAAATYCVDVWGFESPGYLLFGAVSLIGLMGLWVVAPAPSPRKGEHEETRPLIVLAEE